jgi:hypothetical protein
MGMMEVVLVQKGVMVEVVGCDVLVIWAVPVGLVHS